jgi:hypothetical protein
VGYDIDANLLEDHSVAGNALDFVVRGQMKEVGSIIFRRKYRVVYGEDGLMSK